MKIRILSKGPNSLPSNVFFSYEKKNWKQELEKRRNERAKSDYSAATARRLQCRVDGREGRGEREGKKTGQKSSARPIVLPGFTTSQPRGRAAGQPRQCTAYETAHTRTAKYTINQRESPVKPLMPRACATHQHATYDGEGSERDVAVALTSSIPTIGKNFDRRVQIYLSPVPPSPLLLFLLFPSPLFPTRFDRRTGRTKYPRRVSNCYGLIKKFITLCFDSRGEWGRERIFTRPVG